MNPQLLQCGRNQTQVLYQGVCFFRSSVYKDTIYWRSVISLQNKFYLINIFKSSRCHHARLYDCKARFQTKGDKIQKPFLLHTHPLDVKPPPNLNANNTLPNPRSSHPGSALPNPRSSLPNNSLPRNSIPNPMSVIPSNTQPNPERMTINVKPLDVLKLKMNDTV